jgi:hypothetical protein
MLAQLLAAVVLTWIGYELYKASRDPRTHRGDAVLLELGLGLDAVMVFVQALSALMRFLF